MSIDTYTENVIRNSKLVTAHGRMHGNNRVPREEIWRCTMECNVPE